VGQVDKSEWRSRIIRFPIRQVDKFDGGGRSRIDRISLICPRPSLHPQKGRPGLSSMGGSNWSFPRRSEPPQCFALLARWAALYHTRLCARAIARPLSVEESGRRIPVKVYQMRKLLAPNTRAIGRPSGTPSYDACNDRWHADPTSRCSCADPS
jgi:hypothetical protein